MTFYISLAVSLLIVAWLLWSDYRQQFHSKVREVFAPQKCLNYLVLVVPWTYGAMVILSWVWGVVLLGWALAQAARR